MSGGLGGGAALGAPEARAAMGAAVGLRSVAEGRGERGRGQGLTRGLLSGPLRPFTRDGGILLPPFLPE